MAITQEEARRSYQAPVHERQLNVADYIALVLVIIGGLNWGLVGLMQFDLVAALFGAGTTITRAVYVLVALAAIYCIVFVVRKSAAAR